MSALNVPLIPFDEQRAINRVAFMVAMVHTQLSKEWSREWLERTLRQYLRGGLISVIKVVEAADAGDEIADAALREVGAELLEQRSGTTGDFQIIAYLQRAALRAPKQRKRGGNQYDRWSRDLVICVLIQLICAEFSVAPTRNRHSSRAGRDPSGCSLVAAGLKRNGIDLDERSIQRHIWLGIPGDLTRQALAGRSIESFLAV